MAPKDKDGLGDGVRDGRSLPRISLPLTDDGQAVDWSRVRQSTAAKFEGLLRTDPNIRKAYEEENGISSTDEPDPFGGVTEENVRKFLDMIATGNAALMQLVSAKYIKHPFLKDQDGKPVPLALEPDILKKMAFTSEQHAELDPRGVRIAKKYEGKMPSWLRQHFDLYVFGSMFIAYTAENAKAVIAGQVQRDIRRAQENFAQAHQPKGPQPDSDAARKTNGQDLNPPIEFTQPPVDEAPGA